MKQLRKIGLWGRSHLSKTITIPAFLVLLGVSLNSSFSIQPAESQAVFGGCNTAHLEWSRVLALGLALLGGVAAGRRNGFIFWLAHFLIADASTAASLVAVAGPSFLGLCILG